MSINYLKLRKALEAAPKSSWDDIVGDTVQAEDDKAELAGNQLGFGADEVELYDDYITARIFYLMHGEAQLDEDGPYQDEDGNSYDHSETAHFYYLTVTENATTWDKD